MSKLTLQRERCRPPSASAAPKQCKVMRARSLSSINASSEHASHGAASTCAMRIGAMCSPRHDGQAFLPTIALTHSKSVEPQKGESSPSGSEMRDGSAPWSVAREREQGTPRKSEGQPHLFQTNSRGSCCSLSLKGVQKFKVRVQSRWLLWCAALSVGCVGLRVGSCLAGSLASLSPSLVPPRDQDAK